MPVAAVPHIHTFQQRFRFCFKLRCHRMAVLGNCKETLAAVTELLKPAGHKEWLDSFLPYEQMEEYEGL